MRDLTQMQGVSAGLGNQAKNLDTSRLMALRSQQNAADNVKNQLNALTQSRANNTQAILGAMNAGASLFQ